MFINYLEKTKQNLRKNKLFVKKRLKLKTYIKNIIFNSNKILFLCMQSSIVS